MRGSRTFVPEFLSFDNTIQFSDFIFQYKFTIKWGIRAGFFNLWSQGSPQDFWRRIGTYISGGFKPEKGGLGIWRRIGRYAITGWGEPWVFEQNWPHCGHRFAHMILAKLKLHDQLDQNDQPWLIWFGHMINFTQSVAKVVRNPELRRVPH